jgi:SAM-dependent methyltransferase
MPSVAQLQNRVGHTSLNLGSLQFRFLVERGLQPSHYLLDMGCGCFRGGVLFAQYLDDRHYVGLDKDAELIKLGYRNAKGRTPGKTITTILNDSFDVSGYDDYFDFALAHSLFTHLTPPQIIACLNSANGALKLGGRLFASFFEVPRLNVQSPYVHEPASVKTYRDRDPFHQDVDFYATAAKDLGLGFEYIGDWQHPHAQKMLAFQKENS